MALMPLGRSGQTRIDPRMSLANTLIGQSQTGASTGFEALSKIASSLIGAKMAAGFQDEEKQKNQALAQALGSQMFPLPDTPGAGEAAAPSLDPNLGQRQQLVEMLTGNPELARAAFGASLKKQLEGPDEKGFTLGEGQVRFDAQGNPIARGPEKTSGAKTRDSKINDLVNRGVPRDTAVDVVDGISNVRVTDEGRVIAFNKLTNEATELPIRGQATDEGVPEQTEQSEQIPMLGVVTEAFGPEATAGEALNRFSFGLLADDKLRNQARQQFRGLRETLLRAFARSDRPSNFAQQRIEELLPSSGVFESKSRAFDQFVELRNQLQNDIRADAQIAEDPTQPDKLRREARSRINAARRAVQMIGDPEQFPRPGEAGALPDPARKSGVTPEEWQFMTPEERKLFQ